LVTELLAKEEKRPLLSIAKKGEVPLFYHETKEGK
jgi:hypothetical protein